MKIISHRGAKGLAPENTRAAFEAGLRTKADMIEFDIRTSSDGVLVINHDPTMHRLVVAETSYRDLKASNPELTTFQEVFDLINGQRPLLVEIKKGANIAVVIEALKKVRLPAGSIVGSFNFPILKAVKKAFPEQTLLVIHKWSGVIAGHRARVLGTKYIAMNQTWLWSGFIKAVVRRGYKLSPYTMNDPKKAHRFEKYGIDGVVTDHPELF